MASFGIDVNAVKTNVSPTYLASGVARVFAASSSIRIRPFRTAHADAVVPMACAAKPSLACTGCWRACGCPTFQ